MSGILTSSYNQLVTANQTLSTQVNSLVKLAEIVYNTGTVNFQNAVGRLSWNWLYAAQGGWIDGPGTSTSDSIRAMGSPVVSTWCGRRPLRRSLRTWTLINQGRLPAFFAAGNDNGGVLAELRALRSEVAALRQVTASGSGAVVEEIAAGRQDQRRVAADTRQILNRPRVAGARAA
jgi:hypothetical protein